MIQLRCNGGSIAADWETRLRFSLRRGSLIVTGRSAVGNGTAHRLNRVLQLTGRLPFWRSCGHFLASLEPDWALPTHAAREIVVDGCAGVRRDILAICWTRLDEEKELGFGGDVLRLSTTMLNCLTRQWGSIRENQLEWHEKLGRISEALRTLESSRTLASFLEASVSGTPANLEMAISEIEDQASAWVSSVQGMIEEHRESFETIVASILGSPPASGLLAMQSYEDRQRELILFLASEMIRKKLMPTQKALRKRFLTVGR
jgi:hypothetical protein